MCQHLKIRFILLLSILLISCENPLEDRVDKLEDELGDQKIENENQTQLIADLMSQLIDQQAVIDSLNKQQLEYSDSINSGLKSYVDDLVSSQNQIINMLINSQPQTGNNYLRVDSLQICWGNGSANKDGKIIAYPVSFIELPKIFITNKNEQAMVGVTNITESNAKFFVNYSANVNFSFSAMGKWE